MFHITLNIWMHVNIDESWFSLNLSSYMKYRFFIAAYTYWWFLYIINIVLDILFFAAKIIQYVIFKLLIWNSNKQIWKFVILDHSLELLCKQIVFNYFFYLTYCKSTEVILLTVYKPVFSHSSTWWSDEHWAFTVNNWKIN